MLVKENKFPKQFPSKFGSNNKVLIKMEKDIMKCSGNHKERFENMKKDYYLLQYNLDCIINAYNILHAHINFERKKVQYSFFKKLKRVSAGHAYLSHIPSMKKTYLFHLSKKKCINEQNQIIRYLFFCLFTHYVFKISQILL